MKKVLLLAVMALFIFNSCNSSGEVSLEKKDSYTFTTTITITCSPYMSGYPQTSSSVTKINNITESEAKEAAAKLTMTTTSTSGGYTMTSTMKCVYVLTSKYVAPHATITDN